MILKIVDDQGRVREQALDRDVLTIGRDAANDLVLSDRNVSRRHARIARQGDEWVLEDAGSRYGIYVNGERLFDPHALQDGDTIKIGDIAFAVDDPEAIAAKNVHATTPLLEAFDDEPEISFEDGPTAEHESPATAQVATVPDDVAPAEPQTPGAPDLLTADPADQGDPQRRETAVVAAPEPPRPAKAVGPADEVAIPPQYRMKLVGLGGAVAGREHVLTKAVNAIGRTPDNDVMVDHRSVSVAHARIAFENGHFIVHDLGSTNGVSVNDESYQSCVLQYNDVVQFGHVRFRFVRPGDRSDLAAAPALDDEPTGRRGVGVYVALAVLLIAAIAAGFVYVTRFATPSEQMGAPTSPSPAPATKPSATPAAPEQSLDDKVAEAKRLFEAEKWDESKALFEEVYASTKGKPGLLSANALSYLDRLKREQTAKAKFEEIVVLKAQGKAVEAYTLLTDARGDLSPEAIYVRRIDQLETELRATALGGLLKAAEDAIAAERADEAIAAAKRAIGIAPDHEGAVDLLDRATSLKTELERKAAQKAAAAAAAERSAAARAAAKAAAPAPQPRTATAPKTAPKTVADPDAALDGLGLYKKAVAAKMRGDISSTKSYCQKAIAKGYSRAHKLLGNIYQSEGNAREAVRHFKAYVGSTPPPPDASQIRSYIQQLEGR